MNVRAALASLVLLSPLAACVPENGNPAPTTTTTTTQVDPWVAAEGCYSYLGIFDILYSGPKNAFSNASFFPSNDGSCTGLPLDGVYGTNIFVEAPDVTAATLLCNSIDPGPYEYSPFQIAFQLTPTFPVAGMWSCAA